MVNSNVCTSRRKPARDLSSCALRCRNCCSPAALGTKPADRTNPPPNLQCSLHNDMAWNDPQWGNSGNRNKGGPPDLDELWRRLNQRLNNLFGGKVTRGGEGMPGGGPGGGHLVGLLVG